MALMSTNPQVMEYISIGNSVSYCIYIIAIKTTNVNIQFHICSMLMVFMHN